MAGAWSPPPAGPRVLTVTAGPSPIKSNKTDGLNNIQMWGEPDKPGSLRKAYESKQ